MGKKKIFELGSTDEEAKKAKRATQLEQKKLRLGKTIEKTEETPVLVSEPEIASPELEKKKSPKIEKHRSRAYQSAKAKVDPLNSY